MANPSSISRRLNSFFGALQHNDFENAFIHYFPALDKTAKLRRPKENVSKRIKAFLTEEEKLLSFIALGGFVVGNTFNGVSVIDALYKYGRTSIAHEGELDKRLSVQEGRGVSFGDEFILDKKYLSALGIIVILSPENIGEHLEGNYNLYLIDKYINVNSLWGRKEDVIKKIISLGINEETIRYYP
ncbi:hypothetical protein [Acerihabitans arboris]|uniref:Uncharacterized protein n=1 Tax=Acerihabitans arboris TaxID=2691583 RepID=A0A845SLF0_9GAMM|nr:hypothetical protein [Acerihabitans arboris]NDL64819.1 hypothetical protein [Acerihabitans arboris]